MLNPQSLRDVDSYSSGLGQGSLECFRALIRSLVEAFALVKLLVFETGMLCLRGLGIMYFSFVMGWLAGLCGCCCRINCSLKFKFYKFYFIKLKKSFI